MLKTIQGRLSDRVLYLYILIQWRDMNPIGISDIRGGKYGMLHSVRLDAMRAGGSSTTASAPLRFWRDNRDVGCSLLHFPTFSGWFSSLLIFGYHKRDLGGGVAPLP